MIGIRNKFLLKIDQGSKFAVIKIVFLKNVPSILIAKFLNTSLKKPKTNCPILYEHKLDSITGEKS
jgi:hypothetical protein